MHSPRTACRHTVSGSISLPSPGYFSPFPHGTCSLSVAGKCLALRDGPRRFTQGFTCPVLLRCPVGLFRISHTGLSPSMAHLSRCFYYPYSVFIPDPTTPPIRGPTVWAVPVSLATTQGIEFLSLVRLLRCFSSPTSPLILNMQATWV